MNALGNITTAIMGVVGYLIMAQAMSEHSTFRCPKIIAALVAMLGCIGLRQGGDDLAAALLIPFAAVMVASVVVWGAVRLSGRWSRRGKRSKSRKTTKAVEEVTPNAFHDPWRAAR